MTSQNPPFSKPSASSSLVADAWRKTNLMISRFQETGIWPSRSDPDTELALWSRFIQNQFRRRKNELAPPHFGFQGFSPDMLKALIKAGYGQRQPIPNGNKSRVEEAKTMLSKGERLTSKQANQLRDLASNGSLSQASIASLTALGFRF